MYIPDHAAAVQKMPEDTILKLTHDCILLSPVMFQAFLTCGVPAK